MMRAFVLTAYGPPNVLKLQDIKKPKLIAKSSGVLIKIKACGMTAGDCEIRAMNLPLSLQIPLRAIFALSSGPLVLGQQFSGEVIDVGSKVTRFKPGDSVFGSGGLGMGGYAEFITVDEASTQEGVFLEHIPENLSHIEASACPVNGKEPIAFFEAAGIKKGDKVLIIGAGGNMGSFAVQLAKKHYGASQVVAVDSGEKKLEMLKSIGADDVIDYKKEDFLKKGNEKFDVIFDVLGKSDLASMRNNLSANGKIVLGMYSVGRAIVSNWDSQVICVVKESRKNYETLVSLLKSGTIKPIIDRTFRFEDIVEAHKYHESQNKAGNVVITMDL